MTQRSGEVGFLHVPTWLIDVLLGSFLALVGVLTTASTSVNGVAHDDRDAVSWLLLGTATLPYLVPAAPVLVFAVTVTAVAGLPP